MLKKSLKNVFKYVGSILCWLLVFGLSIVCQDSQGFIFILVYTLLGFIVITFYMAGNLLSTWNFSIWREILCLFELDVVLFSPIFLSILLNEIFNLPLNAVIYTTTFIHVLIINILVNLMFMKKVEYDTL